MRFKIDNGKCVVEDMSDFYIFCFTCNIKVNSKKRLLNFHLNHEVDYIRRKDGHKYSNIPSNEIPIVDANR